MGDPDTRYTRSKVRKRNFIAKKLREDPMFKKKIHMSKKDREKQRQWRLKEDPDGDYDNLDEWLGGFTNGTEG